MTQTHRVGIITVLVAAVMILFAHVGVFQSTRGRMTDALQIGYAPPEDVIIIAIDDSSIHSIGRWPWNRNVHAELIRKVSDAGASAIGYDVNFSEPTCTDVDLANPRCGDDAILVDAIRDAGNVVLPLEATFIRVAGDEQPTAVRPVTPIPDLTSVATLGFVNTPPDVDGVFRRVPLQVSGVSPERNQPFFQAVIDVARPDHDFMIDEQDFIVNYAGPKGTFKTISFHEVLDGTVDASIFQDSIVLVGATAADLHDLLLTPTAKRELMPGVEVHANAIATELENNYLRDVSKGTNDVLIVLLALIAAALAVRLALRWAIPLIALIFVLYFVAAFILFDSGLILDLLYVPLTFVLSVIAAIVVRYLHEKAERARTRRILERYVSDAVVQELLTHPEMLQLGGDRREMTVSFADLRGFTSLSEQMSPEELVLVLNTYLDEMTGIIFDHKGVLDKYMGDAIMAFWGAPLINEAHAKHAVESALAMRDRLVEMNKQSAFGEGIELHLGIGINSGQMAVGNMGSEKRFDYTVMGDSVNLAARLEPANKDYGTEIIISDHTRKLLGDEFLLRPLDRVAVKGKKEPVDIFEVVCLEKNSTKEKKQFVEHFREARRLYLLRKFSDARDAFHAIGHTRSGDKSVALFIDRCDNFIQNPPPKDWDGTVVRKKK